MAKHECQDRTGITGKPGEDSQGRTSWTEKLGQNSKDKTSRTEQPGQYSQNGKAEQEKQTGESGQKNSQVRIARVGLFGVECQDC
jgi:hypothetical protein